MEKSLIRDRVIIGQLSMYHRKLSAIGQLTQNARYGNTQRRDLRELVNIVGQITLLRIVSEELLIAHFHAILRVTYYAQEM